ncbi:glycosyltransferase [Leisingera aquaemixtae]|uniref:glycosyltransferase family 4 protein n=1 Tax=Leisingera aquaemixtae TaxID=1396826 RepID=UPI001C952219|nr:glycosyltransferase [Leisingera aquaemixtae]MBY6069070.1 glycosyltransferase [Leisingera aquaemixtae]
MTGPRLRILHETNPAKYFPALYELAACGTAQLTGAHRYSVLKEWLRAGLKDRTPLVQRTRNALEDLAFRLRQWRVRDEIIVMGFAPWDWRLLLYRGLARRNRVLYHTSWHDWRADHTPRQPVLLRPALLRIWRAFLSHPNVSVIAVTPAAADAVKSQMGASAQVIPHAVPDAFFEAGKARALQAPSRNRLLKLLFVGEVTAKKGVLVLRKIMPELAAQGVELTIVGNGDLAAELERAPQKGIRFLGPLHDREELAETMAAHDVLVLPSQRVRGWEELFGIVIAEALAAGLAVLASAHIGPKGILAPAGGAGLFDDSDHDGLALEIAALARDPDRLAALKARQAPMAEPYAIGAVRQAWEAAIASAPEASGKTPKPERHA